MTSPRRAQGRSRISRPRWRSSDCAPSSTWHSHAANGLSVRTTRCAVRLCWSRSDESPVAHRSCTRHHRIRCLYRVSPPTGDRSQTATAVCLSSTHVDPTAGGQVSHFCCAALIKITIISADNVCLLLIARIFRSLSTSSGRPRTTSRLSVTVRTLQWLTTQNGLDLQ